MNLTIRSRTINTRTHAHTHTPVSINFTCLCTWLLFIFSPREKKQPNSIECHSFHRTPFFVAIQRNPFQTSDSEKRLPTKFHFKIGIAWLAHVINCTLFAAHCGIFVQMAKWMLTFIWFDKFTHKAFILSAVISIHYEHNKVMNNYRYQRVCCAVARKSVLFVQQNFVNFTQLPKHFIMSNLSNVQFILLTAKYGFFFFFKVSPIPLI